MGIDVGIDVGVDVGIVLGIDVGIGGEAARPTKTLTGKQGKADLPGRATWMRSGAVLGRG